jgi:hypothetical protein
MTSTLDRLHQGLAHGDAADHGILFKAALKNNFRRLRYNGADACVAVLL